MCYTTRLVVICVQIDASMVKQLDRNLFLGEEIREVYGEIMRTIPARHLDLDDVSMATHGYHPCQASRPG